MPRPYHDGPVSDHFDGVRFFNPGGEPPRRLLDVLRWQILGRREDWPPSLPSPHPPDRPPRKVVEGARLSFVGHASFLIQAGGTNILTDPVFSERASPFTFAGPQRRNAPGVAFDDLPPIDIVLLSHNHYDHLDHVTLSRLWRRDRPRIVAPLGNDTVIRRHDPDIIVETADWGAELAHGASCDIHVVPANHWSARGTRDRNMALWAGYVLRLDETRIYFAGDTGFAGGSLFRSIGLSHRGLDVALLPIGAYEPRWFMAPQHMNPEEAVEAFRLVKARRALGYHWGTFRLTDEGPMRPHDDLAIALTAAGIEPEGFAASMPGKVLCLHDGNPSR